MTEDRQSAVAASFEGGWLCEGLADDAELECGVCWRVYDPARGDSSANIERGTPFNALPDNWRCPECDSPKQKFMLVSAGVGPKRGPAAKDMQARIDQLLSAYRDADLAMSGLPIYNDRLRIAAFGFRPYEEGYIGALVSPWFLNLVYLPTKKSDEVRPPGAQRAVTFPSGAYPFAYVKLEQVGAFEFCSLFSPMLEFDGQDAAQMAATAALEALFEPAPQDERSAEAADTPSRIENAEEGASRRTLLFGRRRVSTASSAP